MPWPYLDLVNIGERADAHIARHQLWDRYPIDHDRKYVDLDPILEIQVFECMGAVRGINTSPR